MKRSKKIVAGVGAAVIVAGGSLLWSTVAGAQTNGDSTAAAYVGCIAPGNKLANNQVFPADRKLDCGPNAVRYVFASDKSLQEATADLQDQLAGKADQSSIADLQGQIDTLNGGKQDSPAPVSASTSVSNWPETSGWANDAFTRTVTVKRGATAPSSNCGGAATCWEYTGSLVDSGTFLTVIGKNSPQAHIPIAQQVSGSMTGGAELHFYSSSNAPDPSLVPAVQDGKAAAGALSGTSTWVQALFPDGTTFSPSLTSYQWVYSAPATCEQWTDGINPGDDGASAADGDITGVVACQQ